MSLRTLSDDLNFKLAWIFDHFLGTSKLNFANLRENIWQKIAAQNKNVSYLPITEYSFPKNSASKKKFIAGLSRKNPFIIKSATTTPGEQTFHLLSENFGAVPQAYVDTSIHKFHTGIKSLTELIQTIQTKHSRIAILFGDLVQKHPELLKILRLDEEIATFADVVSGNKNIQFFLAGESADTQLHAELGSSISIQIHGKKEWLIFSPSYSAHVFPSINRKMYLESDRYRTIADIELSNVGLSVYRVTLNPGDLLYVPAFYWHAANPLSPSVSISRKWTRLASVMEHPALASIILSSRNPPAYTRLPFFQKKSNLHPPIG
jgi:hypothetical protein